MKTSELLKHLYLVMLVLVIGCKSELRKYEVYNSLTLPFTKLEIDRKVDSLISIDKAGKFPIKDYGTTHAFINYYQSKPYFVAMFAKTESNVVTGYKLFFADPLDDIKNSPKNNFTFETLDNLFKAYSIPGTSVISSSLLSTIINDLTVKYGEHKQYKDIERVYSSWQKKTLEIERVFYKWTKEGVQVTLRVKTEPILQGIQIMLLYELSPEYLKENKELIDEMKSKETNY